MRVAHLLPNLAIGGRERMAVSLCRESERLGLTSLLVGYDPLPAEVAVLSSDTPYWQLDRRQDDFTAQLRALLRDQQVDLVHAQGHIPACYLAPAIKDWQDAPASLATMHLGMQGTWRWLWQVRKSLRAMEQLTAVSPDLAKTFARVAGRPVQHLANGIDYAEFATTEPTRHQPVEPFRFAMLSRLDLVKRHADAVHSADQLVATGHQLELHIAGEGAYQPQLQKMAKSRPWLILAGAIHDRSAFLRDKHAFLLPSLAEGMPLALAEAMAAGLPAIVSDLPSLRHMAGDAAMYVPAGDLNGMRLAMITVMQDTIYRDALTSRGLKHALAFDIRSVATDYIKLYQALVVARALAGY